jgi:hypothetical protein
MPDPTVRFRHPPSKRVSQAVPRRSVCSTPAPMPDLLAALDAFLQEHRRCGDLEGGVDGQWVWMSCECGASVQRPVREQAAGSLPGSS